jgi:hypothetical protein
MDLSAAIASLGKSRRMSLVPGASASVCAPHLAPAHLCVCVRCCVSNETLCPTDLRARVFLESEPPVPSVGCKRRLSGVSGRSARQSAAVFCRCAERALPSRTGRSGDVACGAEPHLPFRFHPDCHLRQPHVRHRLWIQSAVAARSGGQTSRVAVFYGRSERVSRWQRVADTARTAQEHRFTCVVCALLVCTATNC